MVTSRWILAAVVLFAFACKKEEAAPPAPAKTDSAAAHAPTPPAPLAKPTTAPVPTPPATTQWKTYTSAGGKYTIELPGEPKEQVQGSATLVSVEFNATAEDPRTAGCSVIYLEMGDAAKSMDSKQMFDGLTLRHKEGATVIEEKDIKLDKIPGRSLVFKNDQHQKWMRLYVVGTTVYMATCGGPFDRAATDGLVTTKVLDSFKLTK